MTKIPDGWTEQEVLDVIDNVARRLAGRFRFGYHTVEDMRQEARLEAWKALDRYDNKRPLENFLWTHVRNRLFNKKRDKWERPDKPCLSCPLKAYLKDVDGCSAFDNKLDCNLYHGWSSRNDAKKNIMQPIELSGVRDEREDGMKDFTDILGEIEKREILELIDKNISLALRADYIKLKHGISIPKNRKFKVMEAIHHTLKEHNIDVEEAW